MPSKNFSPKFEQPIDVLAVQEKLEDPLDPYLEAADLEYLKAKKAFEKAEKARQEAQEKKEKIIRKQEEDIKQAQDEAAKYFKD
jgi:hypothetical protein